jgi:hypothetical protein
MDALDEWRPGRYQACEDPHRGQRTDAETRAMKGAPHSQR